jgi:osmotically-inducible protein OsmY
MRRESVPLLLLGLAAACGNPAPGDPGAEPTTPEATPAGGSETDHEVTAADQSNDPVDLRITQRIRQDVIAADGLSMAARNVQIVTVGGVVTLRGKVADAAERERVQAIAQGVEGVGRIDNELEVGGEATPTEQPGGAQ